MSGLGARLKAFGAFWYDFVVGDDWTVAAAVAAALAVTAIVSTSTDDDWWIVPVVVMLVLPLSLVRVVRHQRRRRDASPQ